VIANGSKAAPKLGGNASAIDYLKNFGHKVVSFSPALCPVKVKSDVLKTLQTDIVKPVTGIQDIYFVFKGRKGCKLFNFDWYKFNR
jgi:predicted flavoprotein YhiN